MAVTWSDIIPARYLRAEPTPWVHWPKGPLLYGPQGVGKTYLAAAYAMGCGVHPFYVRWVSVAKLFADMRRGMDDRTIKPPSFEGARLVVFDDLGKERPTDWVREQFFVIVDDLYNREAGLIVTSNLGRQLEDHVGPYVWSRFCEMLTPMKLAGRDRRLGQVSAQQGGERGAGSGTGVGAPRLFGLPDPAVWGDAVEGGPAALGAEPAHRGEATGEAALAGVDASG